MLEHDDWKKALRTTHPNEDTHGTEVPETPLRLLIKTYPDLVELVFNKCISKSSFKDPSDPDASTPITILSMNYEFIDDRFFIRSPPEEGTVFSHIVSALEYHTRAIITRGLYIFYPIFCCG